MINKKIKLAQFFKSEKGIKIILGVGMLVILIIFISTVMPQKKDKAVSKTESAQKVMTTDEYTLQLENKIASIIGSIEGVGEVKIMVTLENGVENIFAQEQRQNKDKTTNGVQSDTTTVEQSDNLETKTIILQDQNGNKTALLKTQIEPTVKGVVIVCEGGANATVESDVTQAVMTALDIKSNKVCVVKKSK